LIQISALAGV